MIVHQIFLKVSDKTLEDYPCYVEGMTKWKVFCEENGWEHKLWTEIPEDILDDDDRFVLENSKDRHPFIPIDYLRWIVLRHYGGMYVDLDVAPKPKFKEIMNNPIIIGCGDNVVSAKERKSHNNNVVKLPNHYYISLKDFCVNKFKEKLDIPIYKIWKIRFFLRSVSAGMLNDYLKTFMPPVPLFNDFADYFDDGMTSAWDTPALKNTLKNNLLNITIMKVDDCVRINGGKSKKCEGVVQSLMNTFALVRITKDKKGVAVFGDKPTKVKKDYIEVITPPPMEMPTESDLKQVDSFEPNKDIFELIDKKVNNNNNTLTSSVEEDSDHENSNPNELSKQGYMINENNVKQPLITIDDAMNLKEENWKMSTQLASMLAFQGEACKEVANLKWTIKDLQEQLNDSVRLDTIEDLKEDIKELLDNL
jgi:hypothetical protein